MLVGAGICSSSHTPNAPPALRSIAERTGGGPLTGCVLLTPCPAGGKCSVTTSLRQLLHAVESSVLKQALAGPFVVVNFLTRQQSSEHDELRSLEQASGASSERRLLLVRNRLTQWQAESVCAGQEQPRALAYSRGPPARGWLHFSAG